MFRLVAIRVMDVCGVVKNVLSSSEDIIVEMEFVLFSHHSALCVAFDLTNRDGVTVFRSTHNDRSEREWPSLTLGHNTLRCIIPAGLLNYGFHTVTPRVNLHGLNMIIDGGAEVGFEVHLDHSDSPFFNVINQHKHPGAIAPCLQWSPSDVSDEPVVKL
jgi:hypothetical protein